MNTINFGEHLTIDGYNGDQNLLDDKDLIFKMLDELPGLLDMHKLTEPVIKQASGNDGKDPGGWSGFVMILESHISIHTFPKRGFVSADFYTCMNGMNVEFIKKYFMDSFKLKDMETNFIKRGTRYPSENIY